MDTPAKAAIGGTLISTLAFGGMVAAGVLATSASVVLADPAAPAARAAGLERFTGCESLRAWYVGHTLDQVGPWGWGGRAWPMRMEDLAARGPAPSTADAPVSNEPSGTNTQEVGVDEPDVAKTDGRIVVRLRDGRRLVVTDVTGDAPRELASWRLPGTTYADGLLLVHGHAILTGSNPVLMGREGYTVPDNGRTEVYDVDLTDPTHPHLADTSSWAGRELSLREYGDTVRLVTTIGLPTLPFVHPGPGLSPSRAERRNREIVRAAPIEDWVPGLACGEVYHPQKWSGSDTVSVATFRPGSLDEVRNVAVTGAGSEVYSSADRLYVISTDEGAGPVPQGVRGGLVRPGGPWPGLRVQTHIHAFALEGDRTRYVASGVVNGTVRDRWSLDEHDGHLRVAVAWRGRTGVATGENGIVVLDERGGRLEQVGQLHGLGPGEDIQSVRWFDDLAVVVTFRQTDPLYTLDLSDPTHPRRLGELSLPGFSSYLHPIGGGRLLGLGTDAAPVPAAKAALFDVRDARARQVDVVRFGPASGFEAAEDPHAFTWLPDASAAVANLQHGAHAAPVLLRVGADGSLSSSALPSVGDWGVRALPLPGGRLALVGDRVLVVHPAR